MPDIFADHPDLANLGRGGTVVAHALDTSAQIAEWLDLAKLHRQYDEYGLAIDFKARAVGGCDAMKAFDEALSSHETAVIERLNAVIAETEELARNARHGSITQRCHQGYVDGCREISRRIAGTIAAARKAA
ncbi:hypothetical protein [Candidatus Frankia nodulisporulans]|uniref:hypothetical protein n=1 Tax=Candidatus Frankia nodulisporulans TaxID=2060052 RepID=UPI0013D87671|nr:hypothetical protein [Candidatus Frankia nodulisporulans]